MGIHVTQTTLLCYDQKSDLQIADNNVLYELTKHFEIDCHFVHRHHLIGTTQLIFIPSTGQLADLFTKKSYSSKRFNTLVDILSMLSFLHHEIERGRVSCEKLLSKKGSREHIFILPLDQRNIRPDPVICFLGFKLYLDKMYISHHTE